MPPRRPSWFPTPLPSPWPMSPRVMAHWKARAEDEHAPPGEEPQHLHVSPGLDGRWELSGELRNETGQALATALGVAETPNGEGEEPRSAAWRRADALGDICRFFLDHQDHRPAGRHRPHLNVVVDADDLAAGRPGRFLDGTSLDGAATQRLACDAAVHRAVVEGASTILDSGTATRTIPTVERPGGARRALPLPGLRSARHLVRRPSRALGRAGRSDPPGQPRAGMSAPPPPAAHAGVEGPPRRRRHPHRHQPGWPVPHHPAAPGPAGLLNAGLCGASVPQPVYSSWTTASRRRGGTVDL